VRSALADIQESLVFGERKIVRVDGHDLAEVLAIQIEDLDSLVAAVPYEDAAVAGDLGGMRRVELTRAAALLPPFHEVLAILRELDDARVLVAVGYEEVAVRE